MSLLPQTFCGYDIPLHFNVSSFNFSIISPSFNLPSKGIRLAHLNVCHVLPKLDEVKHLLNKPSREMEIMGFTETFLSENLLDSEVATGGFSLERKDRKDCKGGGRVTYISDYLSYERRSDLEHNKLELMWLEIKPLKAISILVCFIYRPPNSQSDWMTDFESNLEEAFNEQKEVVLLGDFNIDFASCKIPKWEDLINSFSLRQLVQSPTRISKTSSTIIDHIYISCPEKVHSVKVPVYAISDHFPVCITLKSKVNYSKKFNHETINYRCCKKFSEYVFHNDLLNAP